MSQIHRRRFLLGAGMLLGAAPLARAQSASKAFRIGFLGPTSADAWATRVEAFKRGLAEHGYVEGKNISIEFRWADGKYERLPDLAAELVRLRPDVIVTTTTPPARAARDSTKTIPIVVVNVADPVGAGLVASLARPGGNITGVANFVGDTTEKQFDLLTSTVPNLARLAVLSNPGNQSMQGLIGRVTGLAKRANIQIVHVRARTGEEIAQAFATIAEQRAEALLVLAEPLFYANRVQLTNLAEKARLPAIYNLPEYPEAGGLMSYGTNVNEVHRYAAGHVDKILKGARPENLPVEQPNKMEFVVNLKAANAIGVKFPRALLVRADRVIE